MKERKKQVKEEIVEPEKTESEVENTEECNKTEVVEEKPELTEPTEPAAVKDEDEDEGKDEAIAEEGKKTRYVGKWIVVHKAEKEYIIYLKASNGQILLTSESYTSSKTAFEQGLVTIKKNIKLGNFQVYTDKKGKFFYKLKDSANRLLCVGEVYSSEKSCRNSIESVKIFAERSKVIEEIEEDMTMIYYKPESKEIKKIESEEEGKETAENSEIVEAPETEDITKIKDQYRGKWIITKDSNGMFMATLYASNGQVLLNSERYKLLDSAMNAIENYKKNSDANNFIIDIDKTGKYYYKLRNSQKLTLCVGETYNTLKRCIAALESFKRFNKIAKVIPYEEKPETKTEE